MNKKEQLEFDNLARKANIFRALRWSDYESVPDVPIPTGFDKLSTGWDINFHFDSYRPVTECVFKACSSPRSHGKGWEKTTTQRPKWLYSTRLKALQAIRVAAEYKMGQILADIDEAILAEKINPETDAVG